VPAGRLPPDGTRPSSVGTSVNDEAIADGARSSAVSEPSDAVAADALAASLMSQLYGPLSTRADWGEPIDLAACLRQQATGQRDRLIHAYWQAAGWAAAQAQWRRQAERLGELASAAAMANGSAGALRIAAARADATADADAAHAQLVEAQYDLAVYLGRAGESTWPLPSTPPRWTPYAPLNAPPAEHRPASWAERRLRATLPAQAEEVRCCATAVTAAEAARTATVNGLASTGPTSGSSLATAIDAAQRQTDETIALLDALTEYNGAIADHVVLNTPPNTPPEQLASALLGTGIAH
jgi:hypothetical protein